MTTFNHKGLMLGVIAGVSLATVSAVLMGQNTPIKSETQYFVTGEGDAAHLWVREGTGLRCVGHGECTSHGDHDDHKEGDGHDHGTPPKKP